MKIIFAGTPEFAATALAQLIEAGHEIALVLSQPDRPSGRGMKLTPSPVKTLALQHGIRVLTPLSLSMKRNPEEAAAVMADLEAVEADLLVVAAYGLILPQRVLDCAKGIGQDGSIKALNIHGSILPRWRGAAPVARAIEAGDTETGITLMKMELGLDTGPMIVKETLPIRPEDTHQTLMDSLADLGAKMLVKALEAPETLTYEVQPEDGVTYAEKILKTEAPLDFTLSAKAVAARVQAFNPFPGSTFTAHDTLCKAWCARVAEGCGKPGEVLEAKKRFVVACGEGAVEFTELQKPGKSRMNAATFLQSVGITVGEVLV